MTERLYYTDSFLTEFTSRIVDLKQAIDGAIVELSATAFYPTSGGQPHDVGYLGSQQVTDVFQENDRVLHRVRGDSDLKVDQPVVCSIDWPRRFDHMQQHSGQHILSRAALDLLDAPTEGFHLSDRSLTVDLAMDSMGYERAGKIERFANQIVWEDRPVSVTLTEGGVETGTRSRALHDDTTSVRVVEIADFDRSACGGTHVSRTGQVGLIKILAWEKVRQHTRVHFACGGRALADYQGRHRTTRELVGALGVQESDLYASVERLQETNRAGYQEAQELRAELIRFQARDWLSQARTVKVGGRPARLVVVEVAVPAGIKPKQVAGAAIDAGADIAVVGCRGEAMTAVVMSEPGLPVDCGQAVRNVCAREGLRGGGSNSFAQIGGFEATRMSEVISALALEIAG